MSPSALLVRLVLLHELLEELFEGRAGRQLRQFDAGVALDRLRRRDIDDRRQQLLGEVGEGVGRHPRFRRRDRGREGRSDEGEAGQAESQKPRPPAAARWRRGNAPAGKRKLRRHCGHSFSPGIRDRHGGHDGPVDAGHCCLTPGELTSRASTARRRRARRGRTGRSRCSGRSTIVVPGVARAA